MGEKLSADVDAFEQTLGALAFSLPGLILCWYVIDGTAPLELSFKSAASIAYLAIFGSLIGFLAFFYVIQKLSVSAVSIIPLMPPVIALLLGYLLNNELISQSIMLGTAIIIVAIALYEGSIFEYLSHKRVAKSS